MYRVTDREGDSEEFTDRSAVEQSLLNTATEEYTRTVLEWIDSDTWESLPMLNGKEIETWERGVISA